jgi:hypothetical protein
MYKPITINNFQNGIAPSAYLGFSKIVGLDIFRKPGVIQAGVKLESSFATVGTPMASIVAPSTGDQYVGTTGNGTVGRLYKNGVYQTNTSAPVHDIVFLNDYLIISTSAGTLDAFGPLSTSPVYYSSWKSGLNTSVYGYKKMFVGRDNSIYIANENQLAAIYNTGTLSTPAFASWGLNTSISSTQIPNNRIITTICEYNRFVAIMTSTGNNSANSRIYYLDLFQADNTSRQFKLTAGTDIPERVCNMMINSNNRLFFFGNDTGTVYTSNQVSYSPVAVIPNRQPLQTYVTFPNGVAQVNNEILWGVGGAFNAAFDTIYGVYGLRDSSMYTKNIISSGNYGQTAQVSIPVVGALPTASNAGQYLAGWYDGTSTNVDSASFNLATSFTAWFDSAFYETGTALQPRTFQTIQFNLGSNLQPNQQLKLQYRTATNESWTTWATYSYTALGAVNSFHDKFSASKTTNIQIRVLFDATGTVYGNNIEVQSVILS